MILDDAVHVGIQPLFDLRRDEVRAIFCRKDDVDEYLDQRLRHRLLFVTFGDAILLLPFS